MDNNIPLLTALNLREIASAYNSGITNFPVSLVNDHVVRMSIMTEDFCWHHHTNSDETFLVIEGSIYIDLEDRTIQLDSGQLFTIPSNIRHRTRPKDGRSVNITFEKADMQTIFDR
jgi:mannose-6-phosphate isomerase-like protein (cupin superfamily)